MTDRIRLSDIQDDNETWGEAIWAFIVFGLLIVALCGLIVLSWAATLPVPE